MALIFFMHFSELLNPIIMNCVGLLKSRAHAQPTVSAILSLMLNISTKVRISVIP